MQKFIERDNYGHTEYYIEAECDKVFTRNEIISAKVIGESNGRLKCMRAV